MYMYIYIYMYIHMHMLCIYIYIYMYYIYVAQHQPWLDTFGSSAMWCLRMWGLNLINSLLTLEN